MANLYIGSAGGAANSISTYYLDEALTIPATALPTSADDIYFTSASADVISMSESLSVKNLTWLTGASGQWRMGSGNRTLSVFGNIDMLGATNAAPLVASTNSSGIHVSMRGSTPQTIRTNGKQLFGASSGSPVGNFVIDGVSVELLDDCYIHPHFGRGLMITKGTFRTNGFSVTVGNIQSSGSQARTIDFGTSTINITGTSGTIWNTGTASGLTLIASQSTIICADTGNYTFDFGGVDSRTQGSFGTLILPSWGVTTLGGGGIFAQFVNISRIPSGVSSDNGLSVTNKVSVTGVLTLKGYDNTSRLNVISNTLGAGRTIEALGTVDIQGDVSFRDITASGSGWAALANQGDALGIGDAQGNTGFPTGFFAASRTLHYVGPDFESVNAWSLTKGGVGGQSHPRPQDDVFIYSGGGSSNDIERAHFARNVTVDATSFYLNEPLSVFIYGDLTLLNNANVNAPSTGNRNIVLLGRGSHSVYMDAGSYMVNANLLISSIGGTYSLTSAISTRGLELVSGTLNTNSNSISCMYFGPNNSGNTRALIGGTSTWSLTGTGNIWNTNDGFSPDMDECTVYVTNTTGSSRTVSNERGALSKFGALRYTVDGGQLNIGSTASRNYNYGILEVKGKESTTGRSKSVEVVSNGVLNVDSVDLDAPADAPLLLGRSSNNSSPTLTAPAGTALGNVAIQTINFTNPTTTLGPIRDFGKVNITSPNVWAAQVVTNALRGNSTAVTAHGSADGSAVALEGDTVIVSVSADTTEAPIIPGFTEITQPTTASAYGYTVRTYMRKVVSPADAIADVSFSTPVIHSWLYALFRGEFNVGSIVQDSDVTGTNSTWVAPSVTATTDRSYVLRIIGVSNGDRTPGSSTAMYVTGTSAAVGGGGNGMSMYLTPVPIKGPSFDASGSYTASGYSVTQSIAMDQKVAAPASNTYVRLNGILIPVQEDRYRFNSLLYPTNEPAPTMIGFEDADFEYADFE